mgnify:CR=1 FL=1
MKKIDISKFQSLIGLIVFSVIVAFINSRFMTTSNILNILRLTGGIDLAVGSILGFSGAVAAMMLASGVDSIIAIPVALIVGLVVGALNGVLISKGKLQPFSAFTWRCVYLFAGRRLTEEKGTVTLIR